MDASNNTLTSVVTQDLDDPKSANAFARQAHHSRSHFFRLFRAISDELGRPYCIQIFPFGAKYGAASDENDTPFSPSMVTSPGRAVAGL